MTYTEFLASKRHKIVAAGFDVPRDALNAALFDFQKDIVTWALRIGRTAVFADTGLGKTAMQLEWARHIAEHTGGDVLILAPLAVAGQTVREGKKFHIDVTRCRTQEDVKPGINVTNYEMLDHFDTSKFIGVVLDESSILKSFTGMTKRMLISRFAETKYKLACTATPAPNDYLELGNHADFLDVMASNEMIARWFINNSMEAGDYRLKQHAEKDFWRWVHSWAVSLGKPSDLGYSDDKFILPALKIERHIVGVDYSVTTPGLLFRDSKLSATTLHEEMRLTAKDRAAKVAEIVATDIKSPWLIWCNTNYEADELIELIPDAVNIHGGMNFKDKEDGLIDFAEGRTRILLSKPSLAGFGMNFQVCRNVAFVGLSYSYEQFYQAIRRCWRFGQKKPVNVHVVYAETEGDVLKAIIRKQEEHEKMKEAMNDAMREMQIGDRDADRDLKRTDNTRVETGDGYTLHLGDSCEILKRIEENSIGLSVFSPPFGNLYIYSDYDEDLGNSEDDETFFKHFEYIIRELHRVTIPGRICAVHCKDLPKYKNRDGAAGLSDFPGRIIRAFESAGWTFHSRVTIWKDPVTEMQRTKNHGLLYKQVRADSSASRQGMADYIVAFRKWKGRGDESFPNPVVHTREDFPLDQWQEWASPIWMNVDQMNVLNYRHARDDKDEKHICPLQLDVIERCIALWSNPGDVVLSPFAGIGSEGYMALKARRRFVGIELKPSYFDVAVKNLNAVIRERDTATLFDEPKEATA